jgi:hypothetical protein
MDVVYNYPYVSSTGLSVAGITSASCIDRFRFCLKDGST